VSWTPSNGIDTINTNEFSISPIYSTAYSLSVTDSNGCIDVKQFNVAVVDSIALDISLDTTVCPGEEVDVYVNGSINPVWSHGLNVSSFSATITSDTLFEVSDSNICGVVAMSMQIGINALPQVDAGNNQEIFYGQKAQLDAMVSNGSLLEWTPAYYLDDSSIEDPLSEPEETTTFVLRVTSDYGCESLDTIIVYVNDNKRIRIPTAFTPNNDSKNDKYFVSGEGICNLKMNIYNRWGELIYEDYGVNASWDGVYNGQLQPVETYAVLLDIDFCDGTSQKHKSHFTLIK
jgi:gliding motility-associated-like protein